MATNPPSGDGHRNGAVKDRSQAFTVTPVVLWMSKRMALLLRESAKKSKSRGRRARRGFPPR